VGRTFHGLPTGAQKKSRAGYLLYFIARTTGIMMLDLRPNRGLAKQIRGLGPIRPILDEYAARKSAMQRRGKGTCTE
jgi:hypothetical protein